MRRVHFALRLTPDSDFIDLSDWIVQWPSEVELSVENNFNEFRGTQISIVLDDLDGTFGSVSGEYYLQGGEEISVWLGPPGGILNGGTVAANGSELWWAGTVDPAHLPRAWESKLLTVRVLQHGALLNTVEAGLPDWTLDANNQLVISQADYHRWKGEADQWRRIREDQNYRNEIEDEQQTVYYTPSALDALTDELYKAKFATKVYHFHTAGRNIGEVEHPFPNVHEGDTPKWTGQFKPHYRPNFDLPADQWEDENNGIVQDGGSYTRNSDPIVRFRRQSISRLVAELVRQYNRTARFPLSFDPDTDCVIISPNIAQQIEILERSADVDFIDIRLIPGTSIIPERLYVAVNYLPDDGIPAGAVSLYVVENETELTPLVERYALPQAYNTNFCWPNYPRGFRFGTSPNSASFASRPYLYTLRCDTLARDGAQGGLVRFSATWFFVNNLNLIVSGPLSHTVTESLSDYPNWPDGFSMNRRANFLSSTFSLEDTPEADPQFSFEHQNRRYTSRQGGLTVSGALFDRVAVDAENVKLSSLLSELAKLTFSRVFVTPDRRLKFLSRQQDSGTLHTIPDVEILSGYTQTRRTFDEVQVPSFGNGLVIPENFRQAAKVWYQEQVKGKTSHGLDIAATDETFTTAPRPTDAIVPPADKLIAQAETDSTRKYGRRYIAERVYLDLNNSTFRIEANQPLL